MGYRSEVVLYVGPEVMPQFMVTMAKCSETRAMCFKDHERMVKDYGGEKGSFLFSWGHIKWYDSYPEVQALTDFMDWCDSEEVPTGEKDDEGNDKTAHAGDFFRFVRIGEDTDDSEQRGDAMWGDICINRSIEY